MLDKAIVTIGGNLDRMIKKGLLYEQEKEATLASTSLTKLEDLKLNKWM